MPDEQSTIPCAVPTRQQFHCLDELVEMAFFRFDSRPFTEEQRELIHKLLRRFGEAVIDEFAHAVEKGTARALTQTAEIFQDPAYYTVTKKKRAEQRRKQSEKWKAQREQQQKEQLQPETPEQVMARRHRLISLIDYHEREAARYRKERDEFEASPETFRLAAMNARVKGVV